MIGYQRRVHLRPDDELNIIGIALFFVGKTHGTKHVTRFPSRTNGVQTT